MADTFKAEVIARVGWKWEATTGNPIDDDHLEYRKQLLNGDDVWQAEAKWSAEDTVKLSGQVETLDLTNLTRTIFGETFAVTFVTVKAILITTTADNDGALIVGGASSDEWSAPFAAAGDKVVVPPGSALLLGSMRCGWPVDASHKNLKLFASGDVTYSIVIVGTTTPCTGTCSTSSY